MKDIFALVGVLVTIFAIIGSTGLAHFRFYFGPDAHGCTKMEVRQDAATKNEPA